MVLLVARAQAFEDLDGVFDRGFFDLDRLEAALQGRVAEVSGEGAEPAGRSGEALLPLSLKEPAAVGLPGTARAYVP